MSVFGWDYPAGCTSVPGDEPELPETCPMCGADNQNEHGKPTHAADPAYCSERCAVADSEAQAVADRLEAEANGECDALLERALGPEMPFIVGARVRYVNGIWGESIGEVLRVEGDRLLVLHQFPHVHVEVWVLALRCAWVMP